MSLNSSLKAAECMHISACSTADYLRWWPRQFSSHLNDSFLHNRFLAIMAVPPSIPHLQQRGNTKQLIVDGKPFLMLGGELQNSSLSSAEYMSEVWPKMIATNVNTLLGAVTWEMIEPEEGTFDFLELDKVILGARRHRLHLILLWFGSWKNGR